MGNPLNSRTVPQCLKCVQELNSVVRQNQLLKESKTYSKNMMRKVTFFKELIQNAEDAGASTCDFLLDFRTHPADGLIDEGMALCNGPCLWTFNNELGAASKENKIEKIGNFGLGFNAVYHLTDIPSILSGKSLLILDPNVTHLEKHIQSKANLGIKLDLFQERLFRRFPGQFRSYEGIFDCDLTKSSQNYYNGTLIKLPFRTPKEACKSEISFKVYKKERINALQKHFIDEFQSPLLFLKNINSVSLQSISEDASTPPLPSQTQKLLKISRKVVCSIKISNARHLQDIRDTLENLDKNCHKVVDCFEAHITEIENKQLERTNTHSWFLYSSFGTKDSLRMFQREQQGSKFSLPVGGVAVPLQQDGHNVWSPDESCRVGQAYCFLPLLIETGLPVHINGSFAVSSNRKALWQSGIKGEWNKALLQDATASAYITTLLELKKMSQNGKLQNYDYYTFWPNADKVRKAFQPLVAAFYSAITQINMTEQSLELFSNGKTWSKVEVADFSPLSVISYLKKKRLNDPTQTTQDLPLPISQTLIKDKESCLELLNFCLSDEKEKSPDLNGLPLFLTHDQMLRKFNSDFPVLFSKFANIFSGHESEFADFSVNDEHQTLFQEGKYIEEITIPVAATFLEPVLQQKLQPSSPTEWKGLHRAETETITWLKELWKFFDDQYKQEALHEETDKIFEKIQKHFNWPILPVICPNPGG
uniref:Sacsin/Nov domain-containing protein n=1 Tax=Astyanax mexicanus TaxID=7994 RepID=A0A3B1JE63_ASTMX